MSESLAELRARAEASEKRANADKETLLKAAVAKAITSHAYGHLSAVAREAGINGQYLRDLVEKHHPGWLDEAARKREAEKRARKS
ncbi:hypothetical protein [Streptomyces spirodelae]|uniref:Uncharacterized protein n=1 Tax=Streptomyces spirodelae TaxID=2812904 RepID=A0ABS3X282_9ACTN|nr:hypothetical protein [Streptomyces spirodelae]MBO8189187.1 hypothetical protein [Streptomyces spirodelae]